MIRDTSAVTRPSDEQAHAPVRATIVNRVHRVVRSEAVQTRSRRARVRSLWLPLAVCSSLLLVLIYAAWTMLGTYDMTPTGLPDASAQLLVMLLWCLPVTAFVLIAIWFRRLRDGNESSQ